MVVSATLLVFCCLDGLEIACDPGASLYSILKNLVDFIGHRDLPPIPILVEARQCVALQQGRP